MADDNTQGRIPDWSPDAGSGWYVIPDDVPRDQLPEEVVQGLEALEVRERERQEQLNRQLELLAQRVLPEQDLDIEPVRLEGDAAQTRCVCGNTSNQDGFHFLDEQGRAADFGRELVCPRCGRIYSLFTYTVVRRLGSQSS